MASHKPPSLSIMEHVDRLFIRIPLLSSTILGTLVTHPYRRSLGWVWKRTLIINFVRALTSIFSARMLRAISPTTGKVIADACAAHRLLHRSELLDCGLGLPDATMHYIQLSDPDTTTKSNRRILFYLHGGGYCAPIAPAGQLPPFFDLARAAHATQIAIVEYTLAPELKYPGQLGQASAALAVLLADRTPADLVLVGDSAGGNLLLGLLAHLKAPHPDPRVLPVDLAGGEFAGALLFSPWVAMPVTAASYAAFDGIDMIQAHMMALYAERFGPPTAPREVYADPVVEWSGFWRRVPAARVLITAGSHECFLDDIMIMAGLMGARPYTPENGKDVKVGLVVAQNETHVQMASYSYMGLGVCESNRVALEWMGTL